MPTSVSNQCCSGVNIDELTTNITKLTQEVTQLKNQIDQLKTKDTTIEQRLHDNEECCDSTNERIDQQNVVIGEQADNITVLKNLHVINKKAIEGLEKKVIIDDEYLNFQEWVENVYIPQCDQIVNKYSEGDIYINVNQDVAATNATYVNIKNKNSNEPCSANDWQELYYSAPADVLTILGIDPIKVTHPYKHEWVISIDPNRLADMLSQLRSLDLTNVEVTLGDVYFTPTFKEDAHFKEDVTVDNVLTTKEINATAGHIEHLCVDEFTCDITTPHDIEGNKITSNVADIDTANIDHLYTGDTHLGDTIIDGKFTYISNIDQKPICLDNIAKNTFKPSYGLFTIHGGCYTQPIDYANPTKPSVVFGLGSDAISIFNSHQADPVPLVSIDSVYNNTYLVWDQQNQTRNVYLDNQMIFIDGSGDDAGIYQITMQMSVMFSAAPDRQNESFGPGYNFMSHRAGIVIYDRENIGQGGIIFDDKHHGALPSFIFGLPSHTHTYRETNDGDNSSGPISSGDISTSGAIRGNQSWNGITSGSDGYLSIGYDGSISMTENEAASLGINGGWRYFELRCDNYYTYSISCAFPVNGIVCVAPFFKPASTSPLFDVSGKMTITEGEWNTGGQSQIFIHKIANLGIPEEYHCS